MTVSARTVWWAPRVLGWRDWWFCWRLARDPVVRYASLDQRKPTPCGHLRWMMRWVHGKPGGERMVWVIEVPTDGDGNVTWRKAGLVRVHKVADRTLEFSVALTEPYRGRGLGSDVIDVLTPIAALYWHREVVARIRPDNHASSNAFQRAGYRYVGPGRDGAIVFEWRDPAT